MHHLLHSFYLDEALNCSVDHGVNSLVQRELSLELFFPNNLLRSQEQTLWSAVGGTEVRIGHQHRKYYFSHCLKPGGPGIEILSGNVFI